MPSNFYGLNKCKQLLNIDIDDTVDDEILNSLGEVANQHTDNILKQYDERIPLKVPNVLADVKMAANYYVCSLFRGKRGDNESAEFWKNQHIETINVLIESIGYTDSSPQVVERFTGRRFSGDSHYLAEW